MTKQALQLQESLQVTVCYPEQPQCTLQIMQILGNMPLHSKHPISNVSSCWLCLTELNQGLRLAASHDCLCCDK